MLDVAFHCCCGQGESSTCLKGSGKAAGEGRPGGRRQLNKGSWHQQKCLKLFYYIQKPPNALLPGEGLQDSCQSGLLLPFNLNMPKWARGFIFVLLHCLPPTRLCFPLRCLWLLLILLFPVLASMLGKLCGLPPFLASFSTCLMIQESFWLLFCLYFTLCRVMSDVLRQKHVNPSKFYLVESAQQESEKHNVKRLFIPCISQHHKDKDISHLLHDKSYWPYLLCSYVTCFICQLPRTLPVLFI